MACPACGGIVVYYSGNPANVWDETKGLCSQCSTRDNVMRAESIKGKAGLSGGGVRRSRYNGKGLALPPSTW